MCQLCRGMKWPLLAGIALRNCDIFSRTLSSGHKAKNNRRPFFSLMLLGCKSPFWIFKVRFAPDVANFNRDLYIQTGYRIFIILLQYRQTLITNAGFYLGTTPCDKTDRKLHKSVRRVSIANIELVDFYRSTFTIIEPNASSFV